MLWLAYTSNNAIPPAQTLVAFLVSVVAGARRFAYTDWLRADKALHALLGIEHFPGTNTVRKPLQALPPGPRRGVLAAFLEVAAGAVMAGTADGFSLDFGSTVF